MTVLDFQRDGFPRRDTEALYQGTLSRDEHLSSLTLCFRLAAFLFRKILNDISIIYFGSSAYRVCNREKQTTKCLTIEIINFRPGSDILTFLQIEYLYSFKLSTEIWLRRQFSRMMSKQIFYCMPSGSTCTISMRALQ